MATRPEDIEFPPDQGPLCECFRSSCREHMAPEVWPIWHEQTSNGVRDRYFVLPGHTGPKDVVIETHELYAVVRTGA